MSKLETGIDNMTRKEVIHQLKGLQLGELRTTTRERKALEYAISSLETDEAYQLEYERTTKNDLGVDKARSDSELIARGDVLNTIKETAQYHTGDSFNADRLIRYIRALPSVTPQEPKIGHWIVQPSNKEQGERDFIWWKCSECGQVIFSETEHDRLEFHAFCGRCGADMREVEE